VEKYSELQSKSPEELIKDFNSLPQDIVWLCVITAADESHDVLANHGT